MFYAPLKLNPRFVRERPLLLGLLHVPIGILFQKESLVHQFRAALAIALT